MTRNVGDAEQVQQAKKKEEVERDQELNDLRAILASEGGRRFIWRQLGLCGVFRSSFTGNSHTFFNEGRREVGLQLLADVDEANPDAYSTMLKESKQREVKSNA